MISVMIVDDELLVRVGIKSTVHWLKLGMEVVSEAGNGEEALSAYKKYQAEIVITDIIMPVMDGLKLTESLKKINPKVKVIILTCYGEFSYAKQAVKLGAFEYIIKPSMTPEDLTDILIRAKKEIIKEKSEKDEVTELRNKLLEDQLLIKQRYFHDIIHGIIHKKNIKNILKELDCSLKQENIALLLSYIPDEKIINEQCESGNLDIFLNAIINIIHNIVDQFANCVVFMDEADKVVMLINVNVENSKKNEYTKIYNLCKKVISSIFKYLQVKIFIGVSNIENGYDFIPTAYKQAKNALERRLFAGEDRINIFYNESCYKKTFYDYRSTLNEIEDNLKVMNQDEVSRLLKELFLNDLKNSHDQSLVHEVGHEILTMLKLIYRQTGKELNYKDYERLMEYETIEELAGWIEKRFNENFEDQLDIYGKGYNNYVIQTIRYIKSHFKDDIGLSEVAEKIGVSPNYLGNIFKKNTGSYFNEYFTRWRVKKAKEFLMDDSLRIYEVAYMVGIRDQRYFSKIFKKYTQMSPNEFKNKSS